MKYKSPFCCSSVIIKLKVLSADNDPAGAMTVVLQTFVTANYHMTAFSD